MRRDVPHGHSRGITRPGGSDRTIPNVPGSLRRKAEPFGGKIDYDIDGTLSGNWFVEGTNWIGGPPDATIPSGTHATFGRHHIDPTRIPCRWGIVEARRGTGPVTYDLVYANLSNGGDPFDGDRYGVLGAVRVEMLRAPVPDVRRLPLRAGTLMTAPPSRRVRIETFPGRRASQFTGFTGAARIYER